MGHVATWVSPPPSLTLTAYASDKGWGYQSLRGHQGQGSWSPSESIWHFNTKELATVWKDLDSENDLRHGAITVLTHSTTVVHCLN